MRRCLLACLLVLVALASFAQDDTNTLESWANRLQTFGSKIPQEEVFVHMDNSSYYLGDTLYYKVYMRLSDGRPSPLSRLLYVELLNQDGYLVERQKIEMKQGQGHGSFVLLDTLYGGYYELRAYTRWQLNWGEYQHPHTKYAEEWFYSKKMAHEYYRDYDKLYSRVFPVYDKPKAPGEYDESMTTRPLRRYFRAKTEKPKAVVSFFPEGGNMVVGTKCLVAFEANDEDGRHLKGTLTVKDDAGQTIATAETKNRGRGIILIDCTANKKLKAEFTWPDGTQEFKLPQPVADGCAMHVESNGDGIQITLQNRGTANTEPLGLTASCHGVMKAFRNLGSGQSLSVTLPTDELSTGVLQLTVFNAEGRVYADRLVFVNKRDICTNSISFQGVKEGGYEPYDSVHLTVKGQQPGTISLAVRDSRNSNQTFETGNILTEMLLSSQIKGFVEQPDYYFESDDAEHREALDLLLMVQGWRRYNWVEMATPKAFTMKQPYERTEILLGEVNEYTAVEQENVFVEANREMVKEANMDADAEARKAEQEVKERNTMQSFSQVETETYGDTSEEREAAFEQDETHHGTTEKQNAEVSSERFYANEGSMKREVRVHAEFVQPGVKENGTVVGDMETYSKGKFKIVTPSFYEGCYLSLAASDTTKWKNGKECVWVQTGEDNAGRLEYPEYYVKLDPIFPRFVKPYSFYQENLAEKRTTKEGKPMTVDNAIIMSEVKVGAKRTGMRSFDVTKPAFVLDAYEAFNDACEAGLCTGMFTGQSNFIQNIARTYIGDMNLERAYDLEIRWNGKNSSSYVSSGITEMYNHLPNLDKVYIYTDYSPRNEGSKNFKQDDQPIVTVNLCRYEDNSQRMTWRDRHMVLTGFAVCEDFYQPNYSQKPLGEPTDYRRTLYWNPDLTLDENGEADVKFYNNSRHTQFIISAEGMTPTGAPLTGIVYP